ncbi:MAG TPA: hypothetical protein GXZ24_02415 [Firmicutes bacterium]|jgi:hypothetical protein|nr:hypothetical protein [Bacillota bacterium]
MKYLITKKVKKLTKDLKNKRLKIIIPKNQMIELAYKTPAGANKKEQIIGAYIYLKMGDTVYPSIVEFSGDEVEIVGDSIEKDDLIAEAIDNGKLFFLNKDICTCAEFVRALLSIPNDNFTIVNNDDSCLRVIFRYKNAMVGKQALTVVF